MAKTNLLLTGILLASVIFLSGCPGPDPMSGVEIQVVGGFAKLDIEKGSSLEFNIKSEQDLVLTGMVVKAQLNGQNLEAEKVLLVNEQVKSSEPYTKKAGNFFDYNWLRELAATDDSELPLSLEFKFKLNNQEYKKSISTVAKFIGSPDNTNYQKGILLYDDKPVLAYQKFQSIKQPQQFPSFYFYFLNAACNTEDRAKVKDVLDQILSNVKDKNRQVELIRILNRTAWGLAESGSSDKLEWAEFLSKKSIEINNRIKNPVSYEYDGDTLALIYIRQGKFDRAEDVFIDLKGEETLKPDSHMTEIYGRVARIYFGLKKDKTSSKYLETALKLDPNLNEFYTAYKKDPDNRDLMKLCLSRFFVNGEKTSKLELLESINPDNLPENLKAVLDGEIWSIEAWFYDWDKVFEKAKLNNAMVFADFYADWCGPCKNMDKTTFIDPKLKQYLANHNLLLLKVNEKHSRDRISGENVRAYPTFIVYDSEQNEIDREVGYLEIDELITFFEFCSENKETFLHYRKLFESGNRERNTLERLLVEYDQREVQEKMAEFAGLLKETYPESPYYLVFIAVRDYRFKKEKSIELLKNNLKFLEPEDKLFDRGAGILFRTLEQDKDWDTMGKVIKDLESFDSYVVKRYTFEFMFREGNVDKLLAEYKKYEDYSRPGYFDWLKLIKDKQDKEKVAKAYAEVYFGARKMAQEFFSEDFKPEDNKKTDLVDPLSKEHIFISKTSDGFLLAFPEPELYHVKKLYINIVNGEMVFEK